MNGSQPDFARSWATAKINKFLAAQAEVHWEKHKVCTQIRGLKAEFCACEHADNSSQPKWRQFLRSDDAGNAWRIWLQCAKAEVRGERYAIKIT